MPRVTNAAQAARREKVFALWTRGVNLSGIARGAGCDWETAKRDIAVLGRQAAKAMDVPRELHRLLFAGREIEAAAWGARDLGQALAAQKQQLAVLQALQDLDTERRLTALEAALTAQPAPALHLNGAARNGHPGAPGEGIHG